MFGVPNPDISTLLTIIHQKMLLTTCNTQPAIAPILYNKIGHSHKIKHTLDHKLYSYYAHIILLFCSELGGPDSGCHCWCRRSLTLLPALHHPLHLGMCAVCGPSSKENRQGTTLQEYSRHYWQYAGQYTAAAAAAASPIPAPAISTVYQVRGEGGADKSVATCILWTGILFKSTRLYYCTGPMVSHINFVSFITT